jgi:D-sedoheptulose 7-phosphate isomerase
VSDTRSFVDLFLQETLTAVREIDAAAVDAVAIGLGRVRDAGGRLFILGVGGSAGHASHAVNDFRKICDFEAYTPTDNVSELTARVNDEGWDTSFSEWLKVSRLDKRDALLIFSVGGGSAERNVSVNLVRAIDEARARGLKIFGIVGRDGGYTKQHGDEVIVIPTIDPAHVTPHSEAFQAVVWHCLACHPALMVQENKWEGLAKP